MANRTILSKAIATVGVVTAAFGGILIKAQPPVDGGQQTGSLTASFTALVILLIISGIASIIRANIVKYIWIAIGLIGLYLFTTATLNYGNDKGRFVIGLPPENPSHYHIIGDLLSDSGKLIKKRLQQQGEPTDNAHLVDLSEGKSYIKIIWTEASVNKVTSRLNKEYTLLMIYLSVAIFSITEGLFYKRS